MKLERIAKEMMRSLYQMQNTNRNVYDYFETFSGRLTDWEVPQVTSDFDVALEDLEVMVEEFRDILHERSQDCLHQHVGITDQRNRLDVVYQEIYDSVKFDMDDGPLPDQVQAFISYQSCSDAHFAHNA